MATYVVIISGELPFLNISMCAFDDVLSTMFSIASQNCKATISDLIIAFIKNEIIASLMKSADGIYGMLVRKSSGSLSSCFSLLSVIM